jgi:hypothetical protein
MEIARRQIIVFGNLKIIEGGIAVERRMPAESSSRSDRPSLVHSQRSAPDTPSRSTIFHPEPPQSGQTSSAMKLYYPLPDDLLNGRQNRAGGNRLALAHRDRGHTSRAVRLHFVLHLHGLDYYDALPGGDGFARLHKYAHNLARHGCDDRFAVVPVRGGAALCPAPGSVMAMRNAGRAP